jgi:hypothetical protein
MLDAWRFNGTGTVRKRTDAETRIGFSLKIPGINLLRLQLAKIDGPERASPYTGCGNFLNRVCERLRPPQTDFQKSPSGFRWLRRSLGFGRAKRHAQIVDYSPSNGPESNLSRLNVAALIPNFQTVTHPG